MNSKEILKTPDYKLIREESRRIDCTISEADFYTSRPNPNRIAVAAGDINRYLNLKENQIDRV